MTLADRLAQAPPPPPALNPHGPANHCHSRYGAGTLEDWQAVEALREGGRTWAEVQRHIDAVLEIEVALPLEKFRYHWRRRCYCWPAELRR